MYKQLFCFVVFTCCFSYAQKKSSIVLDTVEIKAVKQLRETSKTRKLISIDASKITNDLRSFTSLMRYNSPLFLKEYGQGGTSSVSFRGTSASSTAVVWNGININSVNNGQTGFNSLSVNLNDIVSVRTGGGSIEYGTGAIGGTVHINDKFDYSSQSKLRHQFITSIGSFSTVQSLYTLKFSNEKLAVNFGANYNQSDNDYPFLESDFRNSNASYHNYSLNFSSKIKVSKAFDISLFSTNYKATRFLSGELPNPTFANDKYQDSNHRNLIRFNYELSKLNFSSDLAYLNQEYRYFHDKNSGEFNFGSSDSYIANFKTSYNPFKSFTINHVSWYEDITGRTDRITDKKRRQFSQIVSVFHSPSSCIEYNLKWRKDFNSIYDMPSVYALGFKVKPFSNSFLRANYSTNYRVPSNNDLYWPNQGNENLIPESAKQIEAGIGFQNKHFFIDVAYFLIQTHDKVIWTPGGDPDRPGIWTPINLSKTKNTGIEVSSRFKYKFTDDLFVTSSLNYGYTEAKNAKTDKFLPFVPKHIVNSSNELKYRQFSLLYEQLYTGFLFTTTSNSLNYIVDSYHISNVGVGYKTSFFRGIDTQLGFKVQNLFNINYQVLPNRPMPGINYKFTINFKF